jgi:hypothetical protein
MPWGSLSALDRCVILNGAKRNEESLDAVLSYTKNDKIHSNLLTNLIESFILYLVR